LRKSGGIIIYVVYRSYRDVAQFGRALRSGRRGRRFKSCHPDQKRQTNRIIMRFVFFLLPNLSRNNTESEVIKESVLNKYPPV
jgi:hypothetical protein